MDATTRTFFVAGVQYRPDFIRFRHIIPGDFNVTLVGEPKNKFDRYAIKIILVRKNDTGLGIMHIGYVPKPFNVDIWALRDLGYRPEPTLVEYKAEALPYEMFKVQVTFTKNPA